MFFKCALEPFNIDYDTIKKFVSSCHWHYFRKYNVIGHHNLGWGFAFGPEKNDNYLVVKRDVNPIYRSDWRGLTKLKTRFLIVHARKAYPWLKSRDNIHPIDIGENYVITHNGIIKNDSFPKLVNPELEEIKNSTGMDTRKYLCSIMDKLNLGLNLKEALESIFKDITIGLGANAFLFNSKECNVISYHGTNFNGRHRTLFFTRENGSITISTTPLKPKAKEIPNISLIRINLMNLKIKTMKLELKIKKNLVD